MPCAEDAARCMHAASVHALWPRCTAGSAALRQWTPSPCWLCPQARRQPAARGRHRLVRMQLIAAQLHLSSRRTRADGCQERVVTSSAEMGSSPSMGSSMLGPGKAWPLCWCQKLCRYAAVGPACSVLAGAEAPHGGIEVAWPCSAPLSSNHQRPRLLLAAVMRHPTLGLTPLNRDASCCPEM